MNKLENENPKVMQDLKHSLTLAHLDIADQKNKIRELKEENNRLRAYLEGINTYDMQVKHVIEQDDDLKKAWKNFRVRYSLRVNDELIDVAREKVSSLVAAERQKFLSQFNKNTDGNVCPTCHMPRHRQQVPVTNFTNFI